MPIQQLIRVGRTSGGVALPKSELRALGSVDEEGHVKDQPVRVTQTDAGTWKVLVIDPNEYPKAEV